MIGEGPTDVGPDYPCIRHGYPFVPAIFPRRRVQPITDYRRMRRPRAEFIAGCRRDRGAAPAPEPAADRSSFSLSDDELRSHANRLHRQGWSMTEILAVLDVRAAS